MLGKGGGGQINEGGRSDGRIRYNLKRTRALKPRDLTYM